MHSITLKYKSSGKLGDFLNQLSVVCEKFYETGRKSELYIFNLDCQENKFPYDLEYTYEDTYNSIISQIFIKNYNIYNNEIVDFAELHEFMEEKLKNYSSGMQVRLAFSVAIQTNADILVLDEVLAVGDAAFQQKCFDYFEDLKNNKQTVVFVTHDMGAVRRRWWDKYR